jgi:3-oxoacyl-[acyl-carrier-protein] synthase II
MIAEDRLVVTAAITRSAAGDLSGLVDALLERRPCFSDSPPYDAAGLTQPSCGAIPGLDRSRPAFALLVDVVQGALTAAGAPRDRTGLIVGTSSGDLCGPWERWHAARSRGEDPGPEPSRVDPTHDVARACDLGGPVATLSLACASGTAAFLTASAWIRDGRCDAVVVAGVDALSRFVHAGFGGLGALSASRPRPFAADRDGLLLAEGAAALVVERGPADGRRLAWLAGAGGGSDASHPTAPHRDGRGAAASLRACLDDASLTHDQVDTVSVHGTATVYNDAMEARALEAVFGARALSVHGVKGIIGHTLGAAGAIEAAVLARAIADGRALPAPTDIGADCPLYLPDVPSVPAIAISTSSAFGGANAAIALTRARPSPRRPPRGARRRGSASFEIAGGHVDWAGAWPEAPDRFNRQLRYVKLGVVACARLFAQIGVPSPTTGIVMASRTGCRSVDLPYHERLLTLGAAQASRLLFTYTVPGAPAGEASILWNLQGPSLVFLGPSGTAEEEAEATVRHHHAPAMLALDVELPEPNGPGRATATLLEA